MCIYIVYCLLTTVYETISSLFENSLAVNQKLQNLKVMVFKHDIYIYLGHADSALQNAICALMPALKFLAACALR